MNPARYNLVQSRSLLFVCLCHVLLLVFVQRPEAELGRTAQRLDIYLRDLDL